MAKFAVILPAAGRSTRFKDRHKKPFVELDGRAIWVRTAELFVNRGDVCQTIVVIARDDREDFNRRFGANIAFMGVEVAEGGSERTDSIANALEMVADEAEYIAIHDAVRPCLAKEDVDKVFAAAVKSGAAVLGTPVHDTIKRSGADNAIVETIPRDGIWTVQTPQVFARGVILKAYAARKGVTPAVTDDAQLVEASGGTVTLVQGQAGNIKVTTRSDLMLAKAILAARPAPKPKQPLHPFAEDKMW